MPASGEKALVTNRPSLDAARALQALGALMLIVALFLSWFDGHSAWTVFEFLDLLLAALGVVVLMAAVGRGRVSPELALAAAVVAVVVIAVQLISPPPSVFRSADREAGAWLGLAAALVATTGGLLAFGAISVVVDVRGRRAARTRATPVDAVRDAALTGDREPVARPAPPDSRDADAVAARTDSDPRDRATEVMPTREDRL